MIDGQLLKQLGWSDELIAETTRAAEPLRRAAVESVDFSEVKTYSVSASSLTISTNGTNTNQEYRISSVPVEPNAKG